MDGLVGDVVVGVSCVGVVVTEVPGSDPDTLVMIGGGPVVGLVVVLV